MDRIWLKSYPPGVPAEVKWDGYASLGDLFEQCVKKYAAKPAFHCMGRTISYAELDAMTRAFAAWLQAKGFPMLAPDRQDQQFLARLLSGPPPSKVLQFEGRLLDAFGEVA